MDGWSFISSVSFMPLRAGSGVQFSLVQEFLTLLYLKEHSPLQPLAIVPLPSNHSFPGNGTPVRGLISSFFATRFNSPWFLIPSPLSNSLISASGALTAVASSFCVILYGSLERRERMALPISVPVFWGTTMSSDRSTLVNR